MKNINNAIILVIWFFGGVLAFCATQTSVSRYEGYGVGQNRDEAISNALSDAMAQIKGVQISKEVVSSDKTTQDGFSFESTTQNKTSLAGKTPPYKINFAQEMADGRWEAQVAITQTTKDYIPPGQSHSSRRSIIVIARDDVFGDQLKQKIIIALNKSRKFNVLDRDFTSVYNAEKALLKSKDAANDEALKLGKVLGADYILVVDVNQISAQNKTSNLTGKTTLQAEMNIDYRVLLMATRQIKYADNIFINTPIKDNKAANQLIEQLAHRITSSMLESIYPLKIAQISDNQAIFSEKLEVGAVYDCFNLKETIKDSYTKENAGKVENKVASIKIERSTAKLSYASFLDGHAKKGDICRFASSFAEGKKSDAIILEDGGVNVGF